MGLIETAFNLVFGGGRNAAVEVAEVFRENSEARAIRQAEREMAALDQFSTEFQLDNRGGFDRFVDGINRIPRPALALGIIALFCSAMFDPAWFAARMQGLATVPEPLWWLMGAVVSFYFGARHQYKGQQFQKSLAQSAARAQDLSRPKIAEAPDAPTPADPLSIGQNAALADWQRWRGKS